MNDQRSPWETIAEAEDAKPITVKVGEIADILLGQIPPLK